MYPNVNSGLLPLPDISVSTSVEVKDNSKNSGSTKIELPPELKQKWADFEKKKKSEL
ncbi:hypothetical protein [Paenibacillus alvei]|uniref:hypothetical protein n=1 Tax=Paenibacillus alvei TaxID=44250 RepID=UPI0019D5FE5E|nr:hypothetical protein [Paenibacillus alvei]